MSAHLENIQEKAAAYRGAEKALRAAVVAGKSGGESVTDLARAAQVTRQTAYRWINQHESEEDHVETRVQVRATLDEALVLMSAFAGPANSRTLLARAQGSNLGPKVLGIKIGTASLQTKPQGLQELTDDDWSVIRLAQQAATAAEKYHQDQGRWPETVTLRP